MLRTFGIAIVIIAFALVGCNPTRGPQAAPAQPTQETRHSASASWSADGINVAVVLFTDDFNNLVEGNGSMLKGADLPSVAHVDLVTTAKEYEADFDANEIAADRKYHSKKLLLYGTVKSIDKDVRGGGYFTLASSNLIGVQAHLSQDSLDRAASQKRGDRVALACDAGMRIIGFATADNCLYLSQYMQQKRVSPEEQVRGFFSGGLALPYDEFASVLTGYALGISPAAPRGCIQDPSRSNCSNVTKAQAQLVADWVTRLDMNRFFKFVSCQEPSHEIKKSDSANTVCVFAKAAPPKP